MKCIDYPSRGTFGKIPLIVKINEFRQRIFGKIAWKEKLSNDDRKLKKGMATLINDCHPERDGEGSHVPPILGFF